jgi:hypothetical protein
MIAFLDSHETVGRLRMPGKRMGRCVLASCCLLVLLASGGCSKTPPLNPDVEGTLTVNGTPLVGVLVEFVPEREESLPTSNGLTDANGHYKMKCGTKNGAYISKHRVVIHIGRSAGPGAAPPDAGGVAQPSRPTARTNPPVPDQYKIAATSPLSVDVTADRHTYDFDLGKKP